MRKPLKIQGRFRVTRVLAKVNANAERLVSAAILRHDHCHSGGKSHAAVRATLGDEDIYVSNPNDVEGFLTSRGRFVDRDEALTIGIAAGQVPPYARGRTLLSSDIQW